MTDLKRQHKVFYEESKELKETIEKLSVRNQELMVERDCLRDERR